MARGPRDEGSARERAGGWCGRATYVARPGCQRLALRGYLPTNRVNTVSTSKINCLFSNLTGPCASYCREYEYIHLPGSLFHEKRRARDVNALETSDFSDRDTRPRDAGCGVEIDGGIFSRSFFSFTLDGRSRCTGLSLALTNENDRGWRSIQKRKG